ncbi:hypothetical protein EMIT093MI4_140063 [Pseudomonas sp. IT-93MI4]
MGGLNTLYWPRLAPSLSGNALNPLPCLP